MVQAMQILKDKPKISWLFHDDMIVSTMVLAGGAGVISVIGQGFPKEFSDMIRLGLNRKVDEAFRKQYLLSDCIDMILSKEPESNKSSFALGIAENVVLLPLVSVDESLQLRIRFCKKIDK
jgi:4-hydroxy-tetrahydrodipicolinate synthase